MTDQEEFEKARRRLYALADRMGMKLTIIVRRKPPSLLNTGASAAKAATASRNQAGSPAVAASPQRREPGEE